MINIEYKDTDSQWRTLPHHEWRTKQGARNWLKRQKDGSGFRIAGKEERRKPRNSYAPAGWVHVGDIFHASWGYDMSINEFWEVTAVSASGKTCTLRQIATMFDGSVHDPYGCNAKPKLTGEDRFRGEPLKGKRVRMLSGKYANCCVTIDQCRTAFLMEPEDYVRGYYENHND